MKKVLIALSCVMLLTSCENKYYKHLLGDCGLLPAECVTSTELVFHEEHNAENHIVDNQLHLGFSIKLTDYHKQIRKTEGIYISLPDNSVFEKFKNKEEVKQEFMSMEESFINSFPVRNYSLLSLFYIEGIELYADRPFAGYESGVNLADFNKEKNPPYFTSERVGSLLPVPFSYDRIIPSYFKLMIDLKDVKSVKGPVTFELKIPAKQANWLKWMDAKVDDGSAVLELEDIVLHSRFTLRFPG